MRLPVGRRRLSFASVAINRTATMHLYPNSFITCLVVLHFYRKAMVGSFLARAVVDEVLAPAFLSNRNNTHPGDCVVEKAVSLLSREHCTARLEKVWGPGDGRPVTEIKEVMDQLLKVSLCRFVGLY